MPTMSHRELLRRWMPRLLGITPLLVLSSGLLGLAPNSLGLGMAAAVVLLIFILLILYTEVALLSDPREDPKNPLLAVLHRWLTELVDRETAQKKNSVRRWISSLLRSLAASPFVSVISDINLEGPQNTSIRLDLYPRLNATNTREPGSGRQTYFFNKCPIDDLRVAAINGKPVPTPAALEGSPACFDVSGGRVEVRYQSSERSSTEHEANLLQFWFVPTDSSIGHFEFPYTVTYKYGGSEVESNGMQTREPTHEAIEIATVAIDLQRAKASPSSEEEIQGKTLIGQVAGAFRHLQSEIVLSGRSWIQQSRWLMAYLLQLRIQVAIAAICWFLFQTQQVQDVLLALMLDHEPSSFLWATFFGLVLSVLLWHSSRQLTRLFSHIHRLRRGQGITTEIQATGVFSNTFELILFLAAWLSLVLFTTPMAREAFDQPGDPPWWLRLLKPYLLFLAGALFIACWRLLDRPHSTWKPPFNTYFWACFALGLAAPLAVQNLAVNEVPNLVGSVAIVFWALSIILIVATTIYRASITSGIPLLSLLLVTAYLANINRVFDNHAIRTLTASPAGQDKLGPLRNKNSSLPDLESVFKDWIKQHQADPLSMSWGTNKKPTVPIYVVSAQGGGIYAAYHTAKALAVLTDEVPSFDQHIFAISGVSGGSIGATIYRMALKNHHNQSQGRSGPSMGERIDQYFDRRDAMATILASLFFGDLTQRFVPFSVAHWDRALGLELGFENRQARGDAPPEANKTSAPISLDGSFYLDQKSPSHIQHGQTAKTLPYLVLNTTEVENGRRYIISPFRMVSDGDFHDPWPQLPQRPFQRDLRFSTAAALSARFPIVSPYAFFKEGSRDSGPRRRFVDGGFYDNSGAVTAAEIVANLRTIIEREIEKEKREEPEGNKGKGSAKKNRFDYSRIRVIPITIVDRKAVSLNSEYADPAGRPQKPLRLFGWSAIEAVMSSREARLKKAADLLVSDHRKIGSYEEAKIGEEERPPARILLTKDFRLGDASRVYSVPLGWKISCQARAFINDQLQPLPARGTTTDHRSLSCENGQSLARTAVGTGDKADTSPSQDLWTLIKSLKKEIGRN
jgi:hypothetical protein